MNIFRGQQKAGVLIEVNQPDRLAAGGSELRRTAGASLLPIRRIIVLSAFIFWLTALVGVFSAYDYRAALLKFGIISTSILIFFLFAEKGNKYLGQTSALLGVLGMLVAIIFIARHDWHTYPADFEWINRIGQAWMSIRPERWTAQTAPNRTAGILAVLIPFSWMRLALSIRSYDRSEINVAGHSRFYAGWRVAALILVTISILIAFLMTSSVAAWLALFCGTAAWLLWRLETRFNATAPAVYSRYRRIVWYCLGAIVFAGIVFIVLQIGRFVTIPNRALPGLTSAHTRISLLSNSIRLAYEFPIIGAGLRSFPGLYSEDILVTPYYSFGYAHNLYLDAAIEQGWLSLAALLFVFLGSIVLSMRTVHRLGWNSPESMISQAVFVGLIITLVHGIADDALYGEAGTPWLFLLPGMAMSLTLIAGCDHDISSFQSNDHYFKTSSPASKRKWRKLSATAFLMIMLAGALGWLDPTVAALFANFGVIQMQQVRLAGFPTGVWDDGSRVDQLEAAEHVFQHSIKVDPDQRTALYRMGQIELLRRNFSSAGQYLAEANRLDPGHYGVMKNLAYTHVWLGQYEAAARLLSVIPESYQEMDAYSNWWLVQGRPDLAERARLMMIRMEVAP